MACVALVIDMREIDYKKPPGITHEQELELLANVYRLALESYREKKGGCPTAPDDADGRSNGIDADPILHNQHRT